ncbi:beta strand repeat-containing protein [Humibacillus xanthopallidus]|uniref:Cadherin domain-containing protein n=1 Tax=Humibacillus xanthopallidus TaxID=412689 RepID=A0A543H8M8_9MICO|nr:Ig-like domain-containing protein [Humibacillus xanthopallidus]TQM54609.1 cadherin domain-containing protein [Humibacillus xanthopallidus]
MSRVSALLSRIAAACAVLLVAALLAPAGSAAAAPVAGEMSYACALKSNGVLRAVSSLSECKGNETKVTLKPGPAIFCVQPSGSTRLATKPKDCKSPATALTLPPTSGTVYFCAALPSGTLRYVTGPGQCLTGEVQVQVTPNDAAPSVTSTSPADGATHVATDVSPTVTFSEPVTATVGSFAFACDATPIPFAVSGSGGSTLTLDPTGSLPQGASCTVTVYAAGVTDVDSLDPPDNMVANRTFSFETDAAPSLVSSTPVDGAVGVATSTNIVLTFSEPVDVANGAFSLACGGPALPYTVTGSGTSTVTVNPDADLAQTATCTLTAPAADITDVDAGDPPNALTAAVDISFQTVDAAPTLVSISPADGATHVATDANIVMTFSEPVSVPNAGTFSLECPAGFPQGYTVLGLSGTTLTIDPAGPLPEGETCRFTGDASTITDNDAVDPPDNLTANIDASFTVDSPPAVVSTDPADNATNVPADQELTVTFSEPVTVSQSSFTLTCDSNPVAFTIGGTDTAVTLTPTSALPGTAACLLTVVAAQVSDADAGDPPDTMTANVTVSFTTVDTAPTVVSTSPTNGATDVASGATITVTFSEPVTADAGAFSLECPVATTTAFALSGSGTDWTLTPDAKLPAAVLCTLTIDGSKIHDTDTVDPPDEMVADVTVEFTVAANSAPTDLALSAATVAENQPSGTAVGTFSSTDPDPGDTFTYTLDAGPGDTDNGSFTIVGDKLRTAASFDFEAKASYSINVRTTDSAGNVFEKSFVITVTDVNEAPTDISLSNATVAENEPAATVVGSLTATDPDAGQSHTFTVVTTGCGGTYADGSSFTVTGGSLVTSAPLDYEAKSSYTVCVRVTDSGTPGLTFDELFTITVTNVNEAPVVGGDSYSGAIGNTLALRGVTATGPSTTLTGALPLANDTDPEGDTISVVAGTLATTGGGSVTINANGTFSYLPGVGDVGQTDTVTYTVTDGLLTSTGTMSIAIGNDRVWWVNAAAPAGGDGRSTAPLTTLTTLNGAGGSGDVDGPGDYLFVYAAAGSYAGGLALEANQRLHGQRHGLTVGGTVLVPAGATAPTITNAAGNGVTLANGVDVQGVTVSGASADGIHGDNVTTATIGSAVTVSGSGADGIDLTGAATGSIGVAATVTGSTARSVNVSNRSGGTTSFTGPISGTGINLASNTGATVTFSAALTISSGGTSAFSATGGGTVTASDTTSTLTSTTGSTLVVENTTIGGAGLKFRSISANGAANGIRLNTTGSSGGLSVLGGGNTSLGGNASGGTIQNTTGPGVSLTSTSSVSLNNLTVSNTPGASGIKGTGVAGFSFTYGTVTGSGSAGGGAAGAVASNIAFDGTGDGISNVSGAVTVSNSVLTSGYNHGLTIYNNSGVISTLTVTGNTITSAATAAGSIGSGVLVQEFGSAGTGATITTGSISSNSITGFPNGSGIRLTGGNPTSLAAPVSQIGTSGSHFAITGNLVHGFSTSVLMSTEAIIVLAQGRGTSYIDVTNNGTVANPVGLTQGDGISVNATWQHNLTSAITGNVIAPGTGGVVTNRGITGGAAAGGIPGGTGDTAVLNATISNNTVSQTRGNGIYFVARESSTLRTTVQNNSVAAPTLIGAGIRFDSGTPAPNSVNATLCALISGNTTAGFSPNPGIALRKEGTVSNVNTFGIFGLSPSPTTTALETTSYVATQNPASSGGALLVSAQTGFTACTP